MIKKTLYFSRECSLSMKDRQLKIHFIDDDTSRSVPIEDIGFMVIENHRITMTMPLIASLSENNVAVVFTDSHKMPVSMLMTLDGNSVQQEVFRKQIEASVPLNKNLWKQVVTAKIMNQARLLEKLGKDASSLYYYAGKVVSGDADNREGVAARRYWSELFGEGFIRDRNGGSPNNMLNYGYSILRSAVARSLAGSGLLPSIGIFHRNRYNSFPLADDIMEPFRPFLDEIVFNIYENGETELTKDVKSYLLGVLTCDVIVGDDQKPLMVGLSSTTASLAKCYLGDSRKLVLPELG